MRQSSHCNDDLSGSARGQALLVFACCFRFLPADDDANGAAAEEAEVEEEEEEEEEDADDEDDAVADEDEDTSSFHPFPKF